MYHSTKSISGCWNFCMRFAKMHRQTARIRGARARLGGIGLSGLCHEKRALFWPVTRFATNIKNSIIKFSQLRGIAFSVKWFQKFYLNIRHLTIQECILIFSLGKAIGIMTDFFELDEDDDDDISAPAQLMKIVIKNHKEYFRVITPSILEQFWQNDFLKSNILFRSKTFCSRSGGLLAMPGGQAAQAPVGGFNFGAPGNGYPQPSWC